MIQDHMGLLEMGLVFGGVILFLAYQYWATTRSTGRDKDERDPKP